jgi:hypothetical protein
MDKDFTLYPEALELKQLGFDEPCLAFYNGTFLESTQYRFYDCSMMDIGQCFLAPTYSAAFRWFREKHNYHVIIDFNQSKGNKWYYGIIQITHNITVTPDVEFETYEEAEIAVLKELIKTIKGGNK